MKEKILIMYFLNKNIQMTDKYIKKYSTLWLQENAN